VVFCTSVNYFGMMKPAVALQAEGEALYSLRLSCADCVRDPEALRENSRHVALDFLACGLDPERATLFGTRTSRKSPN